MMALSAPRARLAGLLLALPGAALAKEPPAAKHDVAQCIAASEQVQELRRQGKLQKARDAVAVCMDAKCPAMIRTDCDDFSRKIEAALPSVLLRVTSKSGGDVPSAALRIDGAAVALDGRALELDPGPHAVSASAEGFDDATTTIVVHEGVKNRAVDLQLAPKGAPAAAVSPLAPTVSKGPAPGTWIGTGALGVTAVAALSIFAGMGLSANSRFDELEQQCGGRCQPAEVDKLRTRYLIADVSLVVGVVSAVAAGAVLVFGPRKREQPVTTASAHR